MCHNLLCLGSSSDLPHGSLWQQGLSGGVGGISCWQRLVGTPEVSSAQDSRSERQPHQDRRGRQRQGNGMLHEAGRYLFSLMCCGSRGMGLSLFLSQTRTLPLLCSKRFSFKQPFVSPSCSAVAVRLLCPASSAMECLQASLTLPGCGSAPLTLKATDSSLGVWWINYFLWHSITIALTSPDCRWKDRLRRGTGKGRGLLRSPSIELLDIWRNPHLPYLKTERCFAPEWQKNQRVFTKENLRNQMGQKTSSRCSEHRSMVSQSPLLMEIPDLASTHD